MIKRVKYNNKKQLSIWSALILMIPLLLSCTPSNEINSNDSPNIEQRVLESGDALQQVEEQDMRLPSTEDATDLSSGEMDNGNSLNDDTSDEDMSRSVDSDSSSSSSTSGLLDGYGFVEGTVLDSDGNPIRYVSVTVVDSSSMVRIPEIAFETNKEGKYTWSLPEGKTTLQFTGEGYEQITLEVEVVSGEVVVGDVLLKNIEGFVHEDSPGAIIGIIFDSNGQPLDGVSVSVKGNESLSNRRAMSEYGGSYLIELPAGDFVLLYQLDGYEPVEQAIKIGHGGDEIVEIVMKPSK